jgi:2-polyprenyl-6-methoxyphenol hydroxylase-like FAD-dependent oxidoreductase
VDARTWPDTPVIIVGAGPVGSVLALELARHEVPCTVFERSTGPSRHPKMDYVNGRTMELLRRLGVADELRAAGVSGAHASNFVWSRDFAEPPIATWSYPSPETIGARNAERTDGSGAEPYLRVRGSLLEDVLRRRVREHPLIDLREGWAGTDLRQDADGVTVTVAHNETGAEQTIRAGYAVACDGANSVLRRRIGIPTDALAPSTKHCDVYFRSDDPTLRRHGRAFLTIAAGGLTLVSRDEENTWTGTFQVFDDEPVADPVGRMYDNLGVKFSVDEVINVARWEGTLAVARQYRAGRVFLAGDSAHQFYPTGGHGANTGIADAVDIGWKLAACVTGWGGSTLLDSYEIERRPVALFNREMSANLLEVWRRFHIMVAHGFSREHIAGFLAQETYQIDNVGVHFGYRYSDSPVIRTEDATPPPWEWGRVVPTTWPGGRAPSVTLADGTQIFDALGPQFTIVDFSGQMLGERLAKEGVRWGMPITWLPIDDRDARAMWERDLVLVRPDQHVAWRGDDVPDNWEAVLASVAGYPDEQIA